MVKTCSKCLVLLAAMLTLASTARADVIVDDSFSYPTGPITGQNGGHGWTDAWSSSDPNNPNQVTPGSLTFSSNGTFLATAGNMLTTVGNNSGSFRNPPTAFGNYGGNQNQDLWFSFLAANTPTGATSNSYAGLSLFLDNSATSKQEQFFIGALTDPNSGATVYGVQNPSAAPDDRGAFTTNTAADAKTHFIVTELRFTASGTTEAALYIDPTPGAAVDDGTGNFVPTQYADSADPVYSYTTTPSFQFNDLRLQSGPTANGTGANTSFNFDELRMGNTYLDVAPAQQSPAPEPSGKATLLIIGSLLTLILARRLPRRSPATPPSPPA